MRPPHTRLSPQGSAAANQAPPCVPARQPGSLEGGGPVPAALRPSGQRQAGAPGCGRPRVGAGAGRGGGCRLRRPAAPAPAAAARARRGGARSPPLPPGVAVSHLDSEARASLSPWPSSDVSAAVALSSLAPPPPPTASPTRTSRCDWLARSLFSTSCPDWPVLSLAPPYREDTSTPPPRLALPPPQPRFHLGGLGAGAGAGGTRTANGSAERGPGGGLCRRPAQAGKFSQWARAPHPGLRSASLAASVPAGRAQGHTRLAVARERYPLEGWENAARPVRESAGGHCGVLPHRLRGVCERGVVARWWTPGTSARCFVGSEQSVRLVQPRGPNQAAVQNFPLLEQMTTDKSQRTDFAILSFYLHLQEDFSFVGELHDLFSFTNWLPVIAQKCRSLTLKLLSTHGNKIVCMFNSHICISSPCQWTSRKNTVKVLTASLLEGCQ
ncbi:uncharacterized protein LOC144612860 [Panthera onca]